MIVDLRIQYNDINVTSEDFELGSSDKVLLMTVLVLHYPSLGGDHITHLGPKLCLHKPLGWRVPLLSVRLW